MTEVPSKWAPKALLLDLDGTLYPLGRVRRSMAFELLVGLVAHTLRGAPQRGWQTIRNLRAFRSMREDLRALGRADEPLERLQYSAPARALGVSESALRTLVEEWMHERPLKHLQALPCPELRPFLASAREASLQVGVFSDYAPGDKLDALGVRDLVGLEMSATDPEINAFKPHAAGFEQACSRWGLQPGQVLFVGDREELDGVGARAAGMGVCILQPGRSPALHSMSDGRPDWIMPDLGTLGRHLGW